MYEFPSTWFDRKWADFPNIFDERIHLSDAQLDRLVAVEVMKYEPVFVGNNEIPVAGAYKVGTGKEIYHYYPSTSPIFLESLMGASKFCYLIWNDPSGNAGKPAMFHEHHNWHARVEIILPGEDEYPVTAQSYSLCRAVCLVSVLATRIYNDFYKDLPAYSPKSKSL
jgi:hypothetical protein